MEKGQAHHGEALVPSGLPDFSDQGRVPHGLKRDRSLDFPGRIAHLEGTGVTLAFLGPPMMPHEERADRP